MAGCFVSGGRLSGGAATLSAMTELLVAPADKTVLYVSRRAELRLTMVPRYPKLNQVTGQKQGETKGVFIGFRDGHVRIPKDGKYVTVDTLDGGESAPIDVAEVHEWMENHRLFGNQLEGFWRVDPEAPPVSQEEMRALMNAAIRLDSAMLEEIIRQERAAWNRSQILEEAEEALSRIREIQEASQQAEIAAQEAAAEPPAKKPGPKPKPQE
jgi:hypothetical protein